MKTLVHTLVALLLVSFMAHCNSPQDEKTETAADTLAPPKDSLRVVPAAERLSAYLPLLEGKKTGIVANQTARVGNVHLVDTLLALGIDIQRIFAPEHGFRGNIDRGAHFDAETDEKTGLPVVPMFGSNRRPASEMLDGIDVMIFDIQDVGVRFFTYISTMHELMEACAENHKKLLILDRPNPLGDYVDGPVRQKGFESFVGKHPIPVVHGLTVGELAQMINGEKWLEGGKQCDIEIVKVENYDHKTLYSLPVKPSPNLPNDVAIRLYPSLCFFEATKVSVGRGTDFPFQVVGYPDERFGEFRFTPRDMPGMQMNPVQEGKQCYGLDLRNAPNDSRFTLKYLLSFYANWNEDKPLISNSKWFNLLSGNSRLQAQIKAGKTEEEIRQSWAEELAAYKTMRKKYLLYEDFE